MKIRFAEKSDIPKLKELWIEAFGEEERGFCGVFYDLIFDKIKCFVLEDNGNIIAMLHSADCILYSNKKYKCSYIYAVATKKEQRGKGCFFKLFEKYKAYLIENGYSCSIVIPHSSDLFGFYEKFSYKRFFKRAYITQNELIDFEVKESYEKEAYNIYLDFLRKRSFYVEKSFEAFALSVIDKKIYKKGNSVIILRNDGCAEYYGESEINFNKTEDNALILCINSDIDINRANENEKILSFFMN